MFYMRDRSALFHDLPSQLSNKLLGKLAKPEKLKLANIFKFG